MGYMFYIWIGIMVVAVVWEIITTDITSFWFAIGGLAAVISNLFLKDEYIYIQIGIFLIVSLVSLILLRPLVKKKLNSQTFQSNAANAISKEYPVNEDIELNKPGSIKIDDVVWTAVTEKDSFSKGEIVVVERIEGNKLIVAKRQPKEDK